MKCIITGLGGRGLHWVNQVRGRGDCEIVGYVEPNEATRTRVSAEHAIASEQIFATLDEALENVQADFLIDVTPPAVHHEVAKKAFDKGVHVLGEKPLSDNFENAKLVVEQGKAAGVKHMITQNYRFASQPRTMRRVLSEGIVGQPGQCDMKFYMNWADIPGSHYVTEPYMLINDMMVHHFDLLRYVLNDNPESVHATTWNQPWGWHKGDACHSIVFTYASGLRATHVCVGCAVGSVTQWGGDWRIEGTQGSLDASSNGMFHSHLHRSDNPRTEQIDGDSVAPGEQAILDEFLSSIKENREPECSAEDNLQSLAMVFGAIQSAKEGRTVKLSEL